MATAKKKKTASFNDVVFKPLKEEISTSLNKSWNQSLPVWGMTTSLSALVATSLFRFRNARLIHNWAGVALVGFSIWHYLTVVKKPR